MSRVKIGSVGSASKQEKCKTCEQKVTSKDKGIQRDICDGGTKCENINEKAYAVLNMDNIHWFCGACNSVIGRVLPILTNLDMKQTKLKNELKVITVMFRM